MALGQLLKLEDCARVLGGASCVYQDMEELDELVGRPWPGLTVAVNDIGVHFEDIDHWCSVHPEKLVGTDPDHPDGLCWMEQREEEGLHDNYETWTHKPNRGTSRVATIGGSGSSGMLAVQVAYELDCPKVILCGVPMDTRGWFDESLTHQEDKSFTGAESHQRYWRRKKDRLIQRTRSMRGWTQELLGAPTRKWLGVEGG